MAQAVVPLRRTVLPGRHVHRGPRARGAAVAADPPGGGVGGRRAREDDTTVSALARRLGVDWHTLWDALRVEAERRVAEPDRLDGVECLRVDEHVWRPGKCGAGRRESRAWST